MCARAVCEKAFVSSDGDPDSVQSDYEPSSSTEKKAAADARLFETRGQTIRTLDDRSAPLDFLCFSLPQHPPMVERFLCMSVAPLAFLSL